MLKTLPIIFLVCLKYMDLEVRKREPQKAISCPAALPAHGTSITHHLQRLPSMHGDEAFLCLTL